MTEVTTIGVDLAKTVFQIHGVDASGVIVIRKQLRRRQVLPFFRKQPPCLVGMEACATAHHWAREIAALGHEVKLMPPHYVKPYVKRNKNDVADAEAICEAVTRPTMRFVAVKSAEQQSVLMLHWTNEESRRLETTPGIGPITASALVSSIANPSIFKSGRSMAAWIGLVPRQNSSGGKERMGRVSKQGDQYLRWLLVAGAMTVIRHAKRRGTTDPWLANIIADKPTKIAAVALANKNARIAWALLRHGEEYDQRLGVSAI